MMEQLASIPLFKGLPTEQLRDLLNISVEQVFQRGDTIFCEGEI